jgi:transcription initiation factor TFIID subunit 11
MNDLRRTADMHYPSKPSGRCDNLKIARSLAFLTYRCQVIQQSLGQQVSQPVAQIVAGFAKVFVGEIVEKGMPAHYVTVMSKIKIFNPARAVQERRGDTGPLSPDHLREAYRMYQEETGRVGAARPLRSKRLFVR